MYWWAAGLTAMFVDLGGLCQWTQIGPELQFALFQDIAPF
jgi:hypothetical protein